MRFDINNALNSNSNAKILEMEWQNRVNLDTYGQNISPIGCRVHSFKNLA